MSAQETGAVATAPKDATVTTQSQTAVDNGARPGDTHVRIVRLSEANGKLGLDRQTGAGFEQTMQNMPIVQGEKLETGDGYAEVEFEDNSTLRLAPMTRVQFPLLALRSTGAKASTIKVDVGTIYLSTQGTKDNEFLVLAGQAKMTIMPSTHLRMEFDGTKTVLSVFNGSVEVQRGSDTTVVDKKETLTLGADEMNVEKKIAGAPYDAWDKQSLDYHQRYAAANTFAGSGYAFGLSDLNYYGNFINVPGYGSFWQPYFVGAGWSPYSNGVWAMYPGAGYSWVSPYPWGWLPYHSGAWSFVPGFGWGWQPGGSFNGLNNVAGVMNGGVVGNASGLVGNATNTRGTVHSPLRPADVPTPPAASAEAARSLVLSNKTPVVFSQADRSGNFVFQKDSAGLGIPRGSLGNLNKISNDAVRHGSASMPVYTETPGAIHGNSAREASRGPGTMRPAGPGVNDSGAAAASRPGGAWAGNPGMQSGAASPGGGGGGFSRAGGGGAPASSPSAGSMGGGSPSAGGGGGRTQSAANPK
jgi:hypothetical protein